MMVKAGDRPIPEAVMMMIPEAWQDNDSLSESKKVREEGKEGGKKIEGKGRWHHARV